MNHFMTLFIFVMFVTSLSPRSTQAELSVSENGNTLNVAMRSTDNSRIIVYLSSAATVSIDLGRITSAAKSSAWWMDPKTGDRREIGDFKNEGSRAFSTPEGWEDALLVFE